MDLDFSSPSKDARSLALLLRGPGGLLGDEEQLFEAALRSSGEQIRSGQAHVSSSVQENRREAVLDASGAAATTQSCRFLLPARDPPCEQPAPEPGEPLRRRSRVIFIRAGSAIPQRRVEARKRKKTKRKPKEKPKEKKSQQERKEKKGRKLKPSVENLFSS